jgi:hypothetical protein
MQDLQDDSALQDNANIRFDATEKQASVIELVFERRHDRILYGGAMGGGKTYLICALAILLARMYPGSRWAIVRETHKKIIRNLIPTWDRIAPKEFCDPLNRADMFVQCANGSRIDFVAVYEKEDPELNAARGLEVDGIFCDEINEISERAFHILITRKGRWTPRIAKKRPPEFLLGTCNPTQEWPKGIWYDLWSQSRLKEPFAYVPATIADNPHLPDVYVESLKWLPEEIKKAVVDGNWDFADDPYQLVRSAWIVDALSRPYQEGLTKLGLDVAYSEKGDEQVFAEVKGNQLIDLRAMRGQSIPTTIDQVEAMLLTGNLRAPDVRIDGVGIGAGVVQGLRYKGYHVNNFQAGGKSLIKHPVFRFANTRAEGWWRLRQGFDKDDPDHWHLSIAPALKANRTFEFQRLVRDLITPRYSVDSERTIKVESKKEIRKRIGKSPDYADALMMAVAKTSDALGWLYDMSRLGV